MLLGPVLGLTISGTGSPGLGWTAFVIKGGLISTFTTATLTALLIILLVRQEPGETDQGHATSASNSRDI